MNPKIGTFRCQGCKQLLFFHEIPQVISCSNDNGGTIKNYSHLTYKNKSYYFCSNKECHEDYQVLKKLVEL